MTWNLAAILVSVSPLLTLYFVVPELVEGSVFVELVFLAGSAEVVFVVSPSVLSVSTGSDSAIKGALVMEGVVSLAVKWSRP